MSPNDLAHTYAAQALGLTGFVILDWRIAVPLRPDLFLSGVEAGAVNATAWRQRLRTPPGMVKVKADIGDMKDVEVWATSTRALAQRISDVTGLAVHKVQITDSGKQPAPPPPARPSRDPAGDRFPDLVTREPGRACGQCDNYTAGHACSTPETSGILRPAPKALRRCPGFVPLWDATDKRGAAELWPELPAAEVLA